MRAFLNAVLVLVAAHSVHASAATIDIPGCAPGSFSIVARDAVQFENGPTDLTGNVLVTGPDGLARIGAFNQIKGTVIAAQITVAQGAVVDSCQADSITGPGTCTNVVPGGFAGAPVACKALPFNPETAPVCVETGLLVNVPVGGSETLPPGCYGLVRVGAGGTLTLSPGGNYFFGALRVGIGATLEGPTGSPRARVLVKNPPNISVAAKLTHVDLFSAASLGPFQIGNAVVLTDLLAVSAASAIHVHAGSIFDSSAAAAQRVIVEPVTSSLVIGGSCACESGFVFSIPLADCDAACLAARACERLD